MLAVLLEDHEVKSPGAQKGRHVLQHFLESMHTDWEDLIVSVEHVVAEDNWVMGRSIARAIHSRTVLSIPPTNRQINAAFWDLHFFGEDGKITQTWNLIDNAAIMKQIGLLP